MANGVLKNPDLDIPTLHEYFQYEDGCLFWKKDIYRTNRIGKKAGSKMTSGYYEVQFLGERFRLHRAIFAMHHGYWPDKFVDHIDRNISNNRIENLREATGLENSRNKGVFSENKSSRFKCVTYEKDRNCWGARIKYGDKQLRLGRFKTEEESAHAYNKAAEKYYGEFSSLNEIKKADQK